MERSSCIVCRNTNLLNISILENYPISFSPTVQSIDSDIYENLYIDGCQECGTIQQRNIYDASFIYNTSHNNICQVIVTMLETMNYNNNYDFISILLHYSFTHFMNSLYFYYFSFHFHLII